jgi:hypothetical protein
LHIILFRRATDGATSKFVTSVIFHVNTGCLKQFLSHPEQREWKGLSTGWKYEILHYAQNDNYFFIMRNGKRTKIRNKIKLNKRILIAIYREEKK